jgi:hypothetical protein
MEKAKSGRPKLPLELKTKPHAVRLTDARWVKLKRLGSGWLNKSIDKAREVDNGII